MIVHVTDRYPPHPQPAQNNGAPSKRACQTAANHTKRVRKGTHRGAIVLEINRNFRLAEENFDLLFDLIIGSTTGKGTTYTRAAKTPTLDCGFSGEGHIRMRPQG